MTPLHQQLLESLHELEILRESNAHAKELSERLANEEREFAILEKMLPQEQRDVDVLEQIGITSLIRRMIGDREDRIDEEREEYDQVSQRHIERFKSIELIRFELDILNKKNVLLEGVEARVSELLKERERELIEADPKIAGLLKEIKKQKTAIVHQQNRITNAIETGGKAQAAVTTMEQILNNALTYLGSEEPDTRALVYESIRNEKRQFSKVNVTLIRFQNEVKSIFAELQLDLKIPDMNFGQPADFALLEFIDDFLLGQSIDKSLEGLSELKQKIDEVLGMLDREYDETTDKLGGLEEDRKRIILKEH